MCTDFLTGLNAASDDIQTNYLTHGANGVIYTCETDDTDFDGTSQDPPVSNKSALKIYWDESPLDLEKIEKIDTGLAAQNLRYPLYNYVHLPASENPYWPETTAKFEEFLSDRKDFNEISIEPNVVRLEIAKRLGKLHSATDIEGVNKDQYRDHGATWWNTYQTSTHIVILMDWIESDLFGTGASLEKLYTLTEMSSSTLYDEIDFVTRTLQEYYDSHTEDKWLVLCHNNLEGKNIMRNTNDPFDPTTLVLVDFDNAGYGFRIWDLLYNIVNWHIDYSHDDGETRMIEDIEEFFDAYIGAQTYDTSLTRGKLWEELGAHAPYFYLERMTMLVAFGIFDAEYHGMMRALYDDSIAEYGRYAGHAYADITTEDAVDKNESPNYDINITIVVEAPDSAIPTDALFVSLILPLLYFSL